MDQFKISKRVGLGTRQCRTLRSQGLVPGIIYGHGEENMPVSVSAHDLVVAIQRGERLIKAQVEGQDENFLIKDVQYDYLGSNIVHVDFTRVSLDERVEVSVPIVLRGTPVGVEIENGVLTQHLNAIEVECLVTAIPEDLRVQVAALHVGEALHVSDLKLPDGVATLHDPAALVASVTVVSEKEEVPAEEAPAEPEVIGAKPEEEAEEEGESA